MDESKRAPNPLWKRDKLVSILPALAKGLLTITEVGASQSHVLDIACGSGTCALAFAPHAQRVWAIDIRDEQVAEAREVIRAQGISNIEVVEADACHLPFAEGTFDLVTGTGAVSNFDDPASALAEANRVLKADGRLALGDFFVPEAAQEVWGLLSAFRYGSRRPYLDYYQLQDLLLDNGFEITKYLPLRWHYEPEIGQWDLPDVLKKRYKQAIQEMDRPTKNALRLQQKDGRWVVVHDCFVLVATKLVDPPIWEIHG